MDRAFFNFWQDHSRNFLDMAFRTDRRGIIGKPDGHSKHTGECGDTVEIFVSIRENRIQAVAFETDGCLSTNACANTVAHLVEGKDVTAAWEITPEDIIGFLRTLPPENFHCAELAVGALYKALQNFQEMQRSSWKKAYQPE